MAGEEQEEALVGFLPRHCALPIIVILIVIILMNRNTMIIMVIITIKTFVNILNVFCSTIVAASAIDVSGALTASHCCLEKTFVISFVLFKNI